MSEKTYKVKASELLALGCVKNKDGNYVYNGKIISLYQVLNNYDEVVSAIKKEKS